MATIRDIMVFQHILPKIRDFWLIWFNNWRALYNRSLSVVVFGSGIVIVVNVVCAHLPLPQG